MMMAMTHMLYHAQRESCSGYAESMPIQNTLITTEQFQVKKNMKEQAVRMGVSNFFYSGCVSLNPENYNMHKLKQPIYMFLLHMNDGLLRSNTDLVSFHTVNHNYTKISPLKTIVQRAILLVWVLFKIHNKFYFLSSHTYLHKVLTIYMLALLINMLIYAP